jgi:eukaryotic-like serine/threonine-protein kinase
MKYCTICKAKYEDAVSFCPVDGEVLEDDPSSFVNTVLDGQYQIEAMVGKGGMGAVYRARHILLGDRVAIKILPPEMRNNAEWLRRFRREGQAARRFRHPNAVTVYDLRTASDGMIYMVMEYVEGRTLDAELKARGSFTPAEAFEILAPVMSVLNAAHAMGVVHRDLKPENIMIGKMTTDGEPTVKLLDLGIAKLREVAGADGGGNTALTMAGQMLGTPYYMSPEQWGELPRDGNPEIDGRADIYSLGLVFYETIAGQRPYSALTLLELRKEHISATPRHLDEVVTEVPAAFSDAIKRAMAKDRGDRQATANELAAELKQALATAAPGQHVRSEHATGTDTSTKTIEKAPETKSDVNADTIITLDVAPGVGPHAPVPVPAAPPGQTGLESSATIAESADMASSITVPQAPKPKAVPPREESPALVAPVPQTVSPPRRGSTLPIIGGVLVLLLIVGGVGAFFVMNWMKAKPADTNGGDKNASSNSSASGTATAKEAARYWLEIAPATAAGQSLRVAGVVPLASGQSLKFHFTWGEDGYLYIVGPGEQNVPTAFLTTKPSPDSGLQTNRVQKGIDFSFPSGNDHWLTLDKKPGAENYTLIFSPTPLPAPQFLSAEATGRPLTATEQMELTSFVARYKTNSPAADLNDQNAAEPYMTVKLPASGASGNPIVFEIRIEHK